MESVNQVAISEESKLIYWSQLSVLDKAIVAAYIESGYDTEEVCENLDLSSAQLKKSLRNRIVQMAILEVQADFANYEYVNEQWAKAQMLRLLPKVSGDEDVTAIDNRGEIRTGRRFMPDVALNIIKYLVPPDQKNLNQNNQPFVFNLNVPGK